MRNSYSKSGFLIAVSAFALLCAAHDSVAQGVAGATTAPVVTPVAGQPVPLGMASPAANPNAPAVPADPAAAATGAIAGDELNPNDIPSMLFTYWEHTAISDAKRSRGLVRPPTDAELMRDLQTRETQKTKPPPEERDITLGGIVYVGTGDWTIWLNGKRVTPNAIPREVMDLKVHKEYIEMKWFDDYTNQIFPIRLRTHQRFNIDTRIFLPG